MIVPVDSLPPEHRELIQRALGVRAHAYAPYSSFWVGAALRTESGAIYTGSNVENASYGLSICAEVASLTAASSAGDRKVRAIAIVGGPKDAEGPLITPCGRCRQFISEFAQADGHDVLVLLADTAGRSASQHSISELLPGAFQLLGK